MGSCRRRVWVPFFLPTALVQLVLLVVVVLVDPADADAHLLLILRLILADNSIHSRLMAGNCWQTALPASWLLACCSPLSSTYLCISQCPLPLSLQVARLIELSCSLCALAFLLFLPNESWLGFITFMQFMACQCALCSSASCCPGPHTPVQSSLYSQPACCARTAQGGLGGGKILPRRIVVASKATEKKRIKG